MKAKEIINKLYLDYSTNGNSEYADLVFEIEKHLQPLQLKESDFEKKQPYYTYLKSKYFYENELLTINIYGFKDNTFNCNIDLVCKGIYLKKNFTSFKDVVCWVNQKLIEIFNSVKGE